MIVSCIVEGHGEIEALPVLLRRIAAWKTPDLNVEIKRPARLSRGKILKLDLDFERHLRLAAATSGPRGWILILFDSDEECPKNLSALVHKKATELLPHRRISVVVAHSEYEAWFIAGRASLDIETADGDLIDPENIRDAKGWISSHMRERQYNEILFQPRFSAKMDLEEANSSSRSFRKLCKEWEYQASISLSGE
jgi:hypothetical protein